MVAEKNCEADVARVEMKDDSAVQHKLRLLTKRRRRGFGSSSSRRAQQLSLASKTYREGLSPDRLQERYRKKNEARRNKHRGIQAPPTPSNAFLRPASSHSSVAPVRQSGRLNAKQQRRMSAAPAAAPAGASPMLLDLEPASVVARYLVLAPRNEAAPAEDEQGAQDVVAQSEEGVEGAAKPEQGNAPADDSGTARPPRKRHRIMRDNSTKPPSTAPCTASVAAASPPAPSSAGVEAAEPPAALGRVQFFGSATARMPKRGNQSLKFVAFGQHFESR